MMATVRNRLLIRALMAHSGFSLELAPPMSPRVFLGSCFVALSVFLNAVAGALAFERLVNCAVGAQRGGP